MDPLFKALILANFAGSTIPVGAIVARWERIRPYWLEREFRHGVIAFGGGVLLAAVALVLIPEGIRFLSPSLVLLSFSVGGLTFYFVDRAIASSGWAVSQLLAMLLDFVPEAIALGAILATGDPVGLVFALLIALQNLPEGFNAYRELTAKGAHSVGLVLWSFFGLVLLGPLAAFIGFNFFAGRQELLGGIMLFASAGILYLTFQDIAPQSHIRRHWAPALGAVAGFCLALLAKMLLL